MMSKQPKVLCGFVQAHAVLVLSTCGASGLGLKSAWLRGYEHELGGALNEGLPGCSANRTARYRPAVMMAAVF